LSRDKTLIGAGSGSWSPPAFAEALASRTDVDFIAISVMLGTQLQMERYGSTNLLQSSNN
jgi:hypothetical protein